MPDEEWNDVAQGRRGESYVLASHIVADMVRDDLGILSHEPGTTSGTARSSPDCRCSAFATFWLVRGSLAVHGAVGVVLAGSFATLALAVLVYGLRSTAGTAPRPTGPVARDLERAITLATVVQLVASFAAPAVVIAAGRSDWVLPSIAVTIGPLLLWLDHRVDVRRYRLVGWALIAGPVLLAATLSGTALAATTGIGAGLLLLGSAAAGFHDLARLLRPNR